MQSQNYYEKGAQCAPRNSSFDIAGAQAECYSEEEDLFDAKRGWCLYWSFVQINQSGEDLAMFMYLDEKEGYFR